MSVLAAVPWDSLRGLVVVASLVASLWVVIRLSTGVRPGARLRRRFVLGLPWGTLVTCALVAAVYLFVQGGLAHPKRPLAIPFHAWSYFYPLGLATAAFSHASLSHFLGNLVGTIAFASVAEYAWGHFPPGRGVQTFTGRWTNPYVRIVAVPVASVAVGLVTTLFALGPVIGFSGVVFAFAGFALVQRPVLATLALFGSRALSLTLNAVRNPRAVTSPRPRVVTPWWTDVAIQGHAIGILTGLLVGVALARSRDDWPDPRALWFGLVAFAATQGLWAVYAPAGGGRFVLYRWVGVGLVFVLATAVAVGATRSSGPTVPALGLSRRAVALALVGAVLVASASAAVPYNVAPVNEQPGPEPTVQVRDYEVGYADDIEDGYVGAVSVPFVVGEPRINTSGVVVTSDRRYVWQTVTYPEALKNRGRSSVLLGGLGWRTRVYANLTGWSLAGGETVYQVYLRPAGEQRKRVYASDPARAAPVVDGKRIAVRSSGADFEFVVSRNGTAIGNVTIPRNGYNATAGGITFRRNESTVYAIHNRTRVTVAEAAGRGRR